MSTFRYHPMPNPRGGFTTRVALGECLDQQALLEQAAARAGLTPEQTAAAVEAFLRVILDAARDTRWCDDLFGLARFAPFCGGTKPDHDAFHTAEDLAAGVALSFTAPAIREWRGTLTLASQGLRGKVVPYIAGITSADFYRLPYYYAGGAIQIRGQRLNFDPADPEQGVFFRPPGGEERRYVTYIDIRPSRCLVMVPPGLHGPLEIRVTTRRKGTLRTTIYGSLFPEGAAPDPPGNGG